MSNQFYMCVCVRSRSKFSTAGHKSTRFVIEVIRGELRSYENIYRLDRQTPACRRRRLSGDPPLIHRRGGPSRSRQHVARQSAFKCCDRSTLVWQHTPTTCYLRSIINTHPHNLVVALASNLSTYQVMSLGRGQQVLGVHPAMLPRRVPRKTKTHTLTVGRQRCGPELEHERQIAST